MAKDLAQPLSAASDAPQSERRPRQALSSMLWGIDWTSHLPLDLGGGVSVHVSSFDECMPFVQEHYARIFDEGQASPFAHTYAEPSKARYYRVAGDFFRILLDGEAIGIMVFTPSDWSTYYIRSAAVLPEHMSKGIVAAFLVYVFDVLKGAGIERVEADTSPSNLVVMRLLTRLAFNVTGTVLTDRWGAHVHLTRYLAEEREDVFLRQFCSGVRWQTQDRSLPAEDSRPERSSP